MPSPNHTANFLIDFEKFPSAKVRLVPNGVDTDRFVFNPTSRNQWRQRFSIPDNSPVCGIVAALRPEKNHELFIEVANRVGERLPDAHFLIVGEGQQRELMESLIAQKSCGDRIHMAGNSHDIPGALSAMDLFALTSHNEASPVSILEAMSISLPIVAPSVGSIDQAVIEGETGYLADAGDEDRFVELWTKLMSDRQLRSKFGERGRRHVLQYGSLESMTDGYTELVEELFQRKSPTDTNSLQIQATPIPTAALSGTAAISSQTPLGN